MLCDEDLKWGESALKKHAGGLEIFGSCKYRKEVRCEKVGEGSKDPTQQTK
jgi:hypothetical protein